MRHAFAHEAVVEMPPDADLRAPGGAITAALCGHWDHQPPCPLAAHHTRAERVGDHVRLRTLFAAEPDKEDVVRERIDQALAGGQLQGPDAVVTHWQLRTSGRSELIAGEAGHAQRLVGD
jgi:hypothetical protein